MSLNANDDVFALYSRRHSSAEVSRSDLLNFQQMYSTPQAPLRHKSIDAILKDLVNAPIKKQKHLLPRRSSMPQLHSEGRNTICKRLDFSETGEVGPSKKRMHPMMTALHYNDIAVPFSELEVACPMRKAKRVRFSDETTTSPVPETPTYNCGLRNQKTQMKCDSFTKITGPLGMQVNAKSLFKDFSSPRTSKSNSFSKTPARNLNLFLK